MFLDNRLNMTMWTTAMLDFWVITMIFGLWHPVSFLYLYFYIHVRIKMSWLIVSCEIYIFGSCIDGFWEYLDKFSTPVNPNDLRPFSSFKPHFQVSMRHPHLNFLRHFPQSATEVAFLPWTFVYILKLIVVIVHTLLYFCIDDLWRSTV